MTAERQIPRDARVYVAGHRGFVGHALLRRLAQEGFTNVLTATRQELDLRDPAAVLRWFEAKRPQHVLLVAGTVGGILANSTRPAEFIYDNLMIPASIVHASYKVGVEKLLYLASSCIYPRESPQPINEDYLLHGPLEPTNEPYAVAKIAGVKLCQSYRRQYGCNFVSCVPSNLYGPDDNFELTGSHVVPALIRKFHEAKEAGRDEVTIWGTGSPRRDFLYVDDLAFACLFLMRRYDGADPINVGSGEDLTIKELAETTRAIVHPASRLVFDTSKPDGMPKKFLDATRIHALGWRHTTGLREGIERTYAWYRDRIQSAAAARSTAS